MGKWWENFDWRMIQTNLRETDMADIDAGQYVRDLKRFHANVAMINAAGIIASYPTRLEDHFQSGFLTGDSLRDIITACHDEGIRVLARTDFSKIRRAVYERHPEWAYRTSAGAIVDYEGDVHACVNGGYQHDYALEIIRECVTGLDFDGIFFNMGGYQVRDYSNNYFGICHCDACKKLFQEMYGLLLPLREDKADPVYRKYRRFMHATTEAHNERVCRFIRGIRPDILVNRDVYTLDSGMIRQESSTALDRPLPHWPYSGSENTKWVRASFRHFISSNTSVDFIDYPIRHTAVSPTQQETRLWQNLANAGQLDYYLIGRLDNHDDTSGYEGVERVFAYHEKNQALYRDNESVAKIAMLTADHWGGLGESPEAAGLYRMLTEGHYLFDVVFLSRIRNVDLGKYGTLILPDLTGIGDKEATVLDGFVAAGGQLLCTGRTGSVDADGEERAAPALACMGWKDRGASRAARGAYFQLDEADHAVFRRFTGVRLVAVDGDYILAARDADTRPILRMIPPQPFGPPERCYPLQPAGEDPAAFVKAFGSGRCVSVPWYPGRLFHRQGYPNTMNFMLDLLEGVMELKPVATDLPPMVEVTLSRTAEPGSTLLHLVNQTGHFGNSFYPPVVIAGASCTVPMAAKPVTVRSLVSGNDVPFTWADGELTVCIDRLGIFEAIHIQVR